MNGQQTPLTPGRIVLILVGLVILLGVSYWHFFIRTPPAGEGSIGRDALRITGDTMGTYFVVEIVAESAGQLQRADEYSNAVSAALQDVDSKMSTYKPDSELSRFNRERVPEPFVFSEQTFAVIRMAQQVSEQTDGAFDITVGPLVDAWGFGPDGPAEPPGEALLAQLRERVGYTMLDVDPATQTVEKRYGAVEIDLSAIAKGYAVDRIAETLNEMNLNHYMIEIGGEVRTRGQSPSGDDWNIGIESPDDKTGGIVHTVKLSGMALATSGDYRNFYEDAEGQRVPHTIDPRTGVPVSHAAASVSVVHHECALADAYATAMMVLGPDQGLTLAEQLGMPVLFLVHTDAGGFEKRASTAFNSML